jgi:stearoyl-CoA desaturase (delta-9 desaturase)
MDLSFVTHTWWGALLFIVLCGHLTVMCTSLYMHRAMAHQGVHFHPVVSWAMRWWLWLFTGMSTREWVAVHRKHHAYCETEEDPHSPVIHGWAQILFLGVKYYRDGYRDAATMERFTKGCPNDVIERKLFIPHKMLGLFVLLAIDLLLFGFIAGPLVWLGQVLWVPFWAAGVVNGLGHTIGYRNYKVRDESRNIIPIGLLLSGEELHNNHHKFPSSAKFSKRWFELDMGWVYITALKLVGLARVKVVQQGIPNFKRATHSAKEAAMEARDAAIVRARDAAHTAKDAANAVVTASKHPALGGEF